MGVACSYSLAPGMHELKSETREAAAENRRKGKDVRPSYQAKSNEMEQVFRGEKRLRHTKVSGMHIF